jgi:hypothetical protein
MICGVRDTVKSFLRRLPAPNPLSACMNGARQHARLMKVGKFIPALVALLAPHTGFAQQNGPPAFTGPSAFTGPVAPSRTVIPRQSDVIQAGFLEQGDIQPPAMQGPPVPALQPRVPGSDAQLPSAIREQPPSQRESSPFGPGQNVLPMLGDVRHEIPLPPGSLLRQTTRQQRRCVDAVA